MMQDSLFSSLDSTSISDFISQAKHSICYAAPGIQIEPAEAIIEASERIGQAFVHVCIDFDEHTMRMGFGDIEAVRVLKRSGIVVRSLKGIRTGLVIADESGFIFTPIARYLEPDQKCSMSPNAMRLSELQVKEALTCLTPAAKELALAITNSPEEQEKIKRHEVEFESTQIGNEEFDSVSQHLKEVPPVDFNVARQVRVFEPYIQFVEMKLNGLSISRRKVEIPKTVRSIGIKGELKDRLRTTFDLISGDTDITNKAKSIEKLFDEARKIHTKLIGKRYGRVLLKSHKNKFIGEMQKIKNKIEDYKIYVKERLDKEIKVSLENIVNHYLPIVKERPPDSLTSSVLGDSPTEEECKKWLERELHKSFPKAEFLVSEMELAITYKDVTYETLNDESFLKKLKKEYDIINWDKAYEEYKAAGQSVDR